MSRCVLVLMWCCCCHFNDDETIWQGMASGCGCVELTLLGGAASWSCKFCSYWQDHSFVLWQHGAKVRHQSVLPSTSTTCVVLSCDDELIHCNVAQLLVEIFMVPVIDFGSWVMMNGHSCHKWMVRVVSQKNRRVLSIYRAEVTNKSDHMGKTQQGQPTPHVF